MTSMILEWLQAHLTAAPRHIRALGFVYEAIAIEVRHRRCQEAWEPHLTQSRNQILTALESLPQGGEVIVMGSGGLYDVPLDALAGHFDKVRLWDVVHTNRARRIAAAHPNIVCQTVDVTDLALPFHAWLKGRRPTPPIPQVPGPPGSSRLDISNAALVISLNLLSQLPVQMVARARSLTQREALAGFPEAVRTAHVNWLKSLPAHILLITDLERRTTRGNICEVEDALTQEAKALGTPLKTWAWAISPKHETSGLDAIEHTVGAFRLGPANPTPSL